MNDILRIFKSKCGIMRHKRNYIILLLLLVVYICRAQEKPQPLPVVPWSQAKKEYITDPNGGKFRIIEANNKLTARYEGIEFLDASGRVTKSFNLRTAPFAPAFLKARERNDETTLRMTETWIEAKNMTLAQKKSALHPKYADNPKAINGLSAVMTSMSILADRAGENNFSGCIVIKYLVENFVKGGLYNINTRVVIIDGQGKTVDIIDHIPYGINELVLSDDLRYVCYNYADMENAKEDEDSTIPTGLRLYDRKTRKNVIDKYFGETGMGQFPENPFKIGDKIVLTCNGKMLGKKGYTSVFILKPEENAIFRKDEKIYYTPEGYGYGGEIRKIEKDTIIFEKKPNGVTEKYDPNKDFQKMTFEEFNNLRFSVRAE